MEKLIERIIALKNPTVVGLDPTLAYIPEFIRENAYGKDGKTAKGADRKSVV